MNKMFDSISFQAAVRNQPVQMFFFITVKFLELVKHDPILKLIIVCKTETIQSFSQRKNKYN